jgi:hypothetical protein
VSREKHVGPATKLSRQKNNMPPESHLVYHSRESGNPENARCCSFQLIMDSRFRGNDSIFDFLRVYQESIAEKLQMQHILLAINGTK